MKWLITLFAALWPMVVAAGEEAPEPTTVHPQQLSARGLLKACASSAMTGPGRERRRYCDGFVSGVEEAIREGADGYLYKPVTAAELRRIIDRLWD